MRSIFTKTSASLLLTGTTLLSLLSPTATLAAGIQVMIDGKTVVFTDVQTSVWFATYVEQAAQAGIVNGYKDANGNLTGHYGPSNNITLAEALKVAVEGAGYDAQLYGSLVDSGMPKHWASSYFSVAKAESFAFLKEQARVDRPATRAEVASMFASAFRIDMSNVGPVDSRYTDVSTSTQFASSIEALSRDGIVSGDTDIHGQATGTFRPLDPINRAEVAKMIVLARAKYGEPGTGRTPSETSETIVTYTSDGFSPAVLHVKAGTTVTFRNESGEPLWVASNPHPVHTDLSGFDEKGSISQGEIYTFTFTRLGTWGYHNHLHSSMQGTIIVE